MLCCYVLVRREELCFDITAREVLFFATVDSLLLHSRLLFILNLCGSSKTEKERLSHISRYGEMSTLL